VPFAKHERNDNFRIRKNVAWLQRFSRVNSQIGDTQGTFGHVHTALDIFFFFFFFFLSASRMKEEEEEEEEEQGKEIMAAHHHFLSASRVSKQKEERGKERIL
jgi:hypothetical protein